MKNLLLLMGTLLLFLFTYSGLNAQSYVNPNPTFNKVLVDNEEMTAIEVTFEPGKKTPMHTHPAHFIYALTAGKLLVTMENGETQTFDLKEGDSGYFEAEGPHMTVNTGNQSVKILLIELKDHPYVMDKKMKK